MILLLTMILTLALYHWSHFVTLYGLVLTFPIFKNVGCKMSVDYHFGDRRGTMLFSKILEQCILAEFVHYFWSLVDQFGFKQTIGYVVIHNFRSVVDYLIRAFDKISHSALFINLRRDEIGLGVIFPLFDPGKIELWIWMFQLTSSK